MKITKLIFILICFISMKCHSTERWQIVILPDPSYQSSTDQTDIHQTVSRRLTSQLTSQDFDIYSPDYAGLPNCLIEDCSSLKDSDIRDKALASGKDINLALLYQLFINDSPGTAVNRYQFRIEGRFLDLESGVFQESFNVDGKFVEVSKDCTGPCFYQWLSERAGVLAQDLGAVLSEKLSALPRRYYTTINMTGFAPNELQSLDIFIKSMDGYVTDKLIREYDAKAQWLHQIASRDYRYVSEQSGSELRQSLEAFISQRGIPVLVKYHEQDRRFALLRNGIPYIKAYIAGILGILLLGYFWYVFSQRTKHQRVLTQHATSRSAQKWLSYFEQIKIPLAPLNRKWFHEANHWRHQITESDTLTEQAWLLSDKYQFGEAEAKVLDALSVNSDNQKALELKSKIVDYKRGYERMLLGESEMATHPSSALKLFNEAVALNPKLEEKIKPHIVACTQAIHETLGKEALHNAQAAFDAGKDYETYRIIDQAKLQMGGLSSFVDEQKQLDNLRAQLDGRNKPVSGEAQGTSALANCTFYLSDVLEIARTVDNSKQGIALGYKRISRAGKQSQITRQGQSYYLEDLGSSNGTLYSGQQITPGSKTALKDGGNLSLGIGVGSTTPGACQFDTLLPSASNATLVLKLSKGALAFLDNTNMLEAWPTMDEDLSKVWVMMGGTLAIGVKDNGQLDIGGSKSEALAVITYDNGYYIAPAKPNVEYSDIAATGEPVYGRIPITEGSAISIKGQLFSLEAMQ